MNTHVFAKDKLDEEVHFIGQKGALMARTNTNKRRDRKIFARTASSTKKMNISPKVMRGGTRL